MTDGSGISNRWSGKQEREDRARIEKKAQKRAGDKE